MGRTRTLTSCIKPLEGEALLNASERCKRVEFGVHIYCLRRRCVERAKWWVRFRNQETLLDDDHAFCTEHALEVIARG